MARRGGSSIYVSTNPNVPVNVGTPGVSVFIGTPGPTIYGGSGALPPEGGTGLTIIGGNLTFTPATVPVGLEF